MDSLKDLIDELFLVRYQIIVILQVIISTLMDRSLITSTILVKERPLIGFKIAPSEAQVCSMKKTPIL